MPLINLGHTKGLDDGYDNTVPAGTLGAPHASKDSGLEIRSIISWKMS